MRPHAAESASDAQRLMAFRKYDLYILDVRLPGTSGWELCRAVRAQNHDVPVIIYWRGAYESDKALANKNGATMYLVKPDGINVIAKEVSSRNSSTNYWARQPIAFGNTRLVQNNQQQSICACHIPLMTIWRPGQKPIRKNLFEIGSYMLTSPDCPLLRTNRRTNYKE